MTNEEAIRVLKAEWVSKESGFPDKVVREALDTAIESIECSEKFQQKAEVVISQLRADRDRLEDAIAEIRSEIEALQNANPSYWHSGDMVDRDDVLDIINKYKAESEGKK